MIPINPVYASCGIDTSLQAAEMINVPELSYCDDPTKIKYIPVAIHFVLPENKVTLNVDVLVEEKDTVWTFEDVEGNFTELQDGIGNFNYNGFQRAEDIVNEMNVEFEESSDHWRTVPGFTYDPEGEEPYIRFLLKGVYFIRDDAYYGLPWKLNSIHAEHNKGGDEVIDIYCNTYTSPGGYVDGLGPADKKASVSNYRVYLGNHHPYFKLFFAAKNNNHEIGHLLNLRHTWSGEDFCGDTPEGEWFDAKLPNGSCAERRANCWVFGENDDDCELPNSRKQCDDWSKVSNNMMDYSGYEKSAMTPCQVDRMLTHLRMPAGNSYIHSCNGCMPAQSFFYMKDTVVKCGILKYVRINAQASFNEDEYLIEICKVNGNQQSTCFSHYFNSGWNSGQLDKVNLVNMYPHTFQVGSWYKIELTVNNSTCPLTDSYVDYVYIEDCSVSGPQGPIDEFEVISVTNPFLDQLNVQYEVYKETDLSFSLYHPQSNSTTLLHEATNVQAGTYSFTNTYSIAPLYSGSYYLVATSSGNDFHSEILIK